MKEKTIISELRRENEELRRQLVEAEKQKLKEKEVTHLASFSHNNPDPVIEVDFSGKITYANPAADRILNESSGDSPHENIFLIPDLSEILKKKAREEKEVSINNEISINERVFLESITILPEFKVIRIYAREITERKAAEEALVQARNMLAEGQKIAHLGSFEYIAATRKTIWSEEEYRIYGLEPSKPSPEYDVMLAECIHPDDAALLHETFTKAMQSRSIWELEHRIVRPDGSTRWVHDSAHPYFDEQGDLVRYVGTSLDVTGRKQLEDELKKYSETLEERVRTRTAELSRAEKELRRAAGYNRTLIEASPDPLVTIGPDGKITDVNKATEQFTGCARNELVGTDFSDYFTEPERARAGYREAFAKGEVHDYSLDLRHSDGRIFHVLYNASVYRDEAGTVAGVFAAARDVTLRRKAEETVAAERKRLYDVLETLPVYVVLLDRDYRVPFANRFFRERFGESHGRRCYEYLFKKSEECENCETYKVMKTHAPHHWEWTGPDGRNYDIYDFPFKDTDGSEMIMEMGIDITERKQAEVSLGKERKRFYDVLETVPAMVCLLTPDYHVAFANKAFRDKFGESHGRHCYEYCFGKNEPCGFCESYRVLETGEPHHWELTTPDGSVIESYDFPFTDTDGSPLILEMEIDITGYRKAQKDLLYAQAEVERAKRLSDIGVLAATVAHELRNPLAAISLAAHNIKRKADNPNLEKHLASINKKVSESDQIINNLLFYSRLKPPHFVKVDILDVLAESIEAAEDKNNKQLSIIKNIETLKGISLEADPHQLKEVFNNILNNSYEAVFPDRGEIMITSEINDYDVMVSIEDNGPGIAQDIIDKIFDPFFTTKATGTGLGLSVCRQVINMHGGEIHVKHGRAKGTCLTVRLPRESKRDQPAF